jgi:hypothetical protein
MPQPYHALKATADEAPDWKSPKANGHLNGATRSHPLSAGE